MQAVARMETVAKRILGAGSVAGRQRVARDLNQLDLNR